jgi:hypothetical protein
MCLVNNYAKLIGLGVKSFNERAAIGHKTTCFATCFGVFSRIKGTRFKVYAALV